MMLTLSIKKQDVKRLEPQLRKIKNREKYYIRRYREIVVCAYFAVPNRYII